MCILMLASPAYSSLIKCQAAYEINNDLCRQSGINCYSLFRLDQKEKIIEKIISFGKYTNVVRLNVEYWSEEKIIAVDNKYSSTVFLSPLDGLFVKTEYAFDRYGGNLTESTRFYNKSYQLLSRDALKDYDLPFAAKYLSENLKTSECRAHERQI